MKAAFLTCLVLILGMTGSAIAMDWHWDVKLRDSNGDTIPYNADGTPAPAYSAKQTCGACHNYELMERNSYHAQLGNNQMVGWAAWNPNSPSKFKSGVAAKGKNWVQSPGHVGKW